MTSTTAETDLGIGLGLVFGLVAIGAVVLTAVHGYLYAVTHVEQVQVTAGIAFGIAMLMAGLSIVAIHVYQS